VASPFGPEPTGVGWGRGGAQWRLRSFTVQKIELHPDAGNAILTLLDRRHIDALIWDTGYKRLTSGRLETGVARFYPDVTRTYTRPSKAYVSSPADADVVVAVPYNLPAISYDGELFEAGATNFLLRSSLKEGTTGLTLSGTGVNGSAIATDTTELLFDQDITEYALKFTAGNPHTTELSARWPDTESIDYGFYGQEFRLSVDHMDDSGATLYFRVKRLVDNQFWNDSSETWGSTVDNPITNSTTRARFSSSIIDIGAANTVIQLELLQQSGGTAARVNRVFHVQLENQLCAGSRIVTDDVKFERAATVLSYTQISNARRCYQEDQGTFFCEVVPFFDSDDGLGGTIYNIEYPDEPIEFQHNLSYDTSTDVFKFTVFIDPNTYAATFSQTVTRGTVYKVACRWTYDSGELDLPNYTYSVFVDGVKGTDDTGEAPPTITWAGELLNFGVFNGIIRRRCLIPYPMTDEEIARFEV
jgi:hypothetical protein